MGHMPTINIDFGSSGVGENYNKNTKKYTNHKCLVQQIFRKWTDSHKLHADKIVTKAQKYHLCPLPVIPLLITPLICSPLRIVDLLPGEFH